MRAAPLVAVIASRVLLAGAGPAVPPAPTRYVTDRANVLSAAMVARLEKRLQDFEDATSNQFLVLLETKVPEKTTLEEYTVACAQAWKAGGKERKNGLVLFVFPGDRAARFEVGYGLEGALPDALAGRILNEQAIPYFVKGEWEGGIEAAVDAAIAATKGEYAGTGRRRPPPQQRSRGSAFVFWALFVIFVVLPFFMKRSRRPYFWIGGGGFGGGGFGGFGGGGFGGGGGFSGGGGSFGGGGATGRW